MVERLKGVIPRTWLVAGAICITGCGDASVGSAGVGGVGGSGGAIGGGAGSGGSVADGGTSNSSGGSSGSSGSNAGSGAGGTAPARTCAATLPFGAPVAVSSLNTANWEAAARLTADELTVVFYARLPDDDGLTDADLYIAERPSRTDAFAAPHLLALNQESVDEMRPWISEDGLTLLYDVGDAQDSGSSTDRNMLRATRATRQEEFVAVGQLGAGESPFVVGGENGTLYYAAAQVNGAIVQQPLAAWLPGLPELEIMPAPSERPLLTSNELTLYFAAGPNYEEVHVAERADPSAPFETEQVVAELLDGYAPDWLSVDGCRLYYDRNVPGGDLDIYMVERTP